MRRKLHIVLMVVEVLLVAFVVFDWATSYLWPRAWGSAKLSVMVVDGSVTIQSMAVTGGSLQISAWGIEDRTSRPPLGELARNLVHFSLWRSPPPAPGKTIFWIRTTALEFPEWVLVVPPSLALALMWRSWRRRRYAPRPAFPVVAKAREA